MTIYNEILIGCNFAVGLWCFYEAINTWRIWDKFDWIFIVGGVTNLFLGVLNIWRYK
jgi:hypothetical protein